MIFARIYITVLLGVVEVGLVVGFIKTLGENGALGVLASVGIFMLIIFFGWIVFIFIIRGGGNGSSGGGLGGCGGGGGGCGGGGGGGGGGCGGGGS